MMVELADLFTVFENIKSVLLCTPTSRQINLVHVRVNQAVVYHIPTASYFQIVWLIEDLRKAENECACEGNIKVATQLFNNFGFSAAAQPQVHELSLNLRKVTAWCGIVASGILGPYFFEENDRAVTVMVFEDVTKLQHKHLWFQDGEAINYTA
ncbi:hypothetical protein Trydic_g17438 [Trypoxylus dichotomus]